MVISDWPLIFYQFHSKLVESYYNISIPEIVCIIILFPLKISTE